MVVVYVNVGDIVYVRVRLVESGILIGWESSFLGFFLYLE